MDRECTCAITTEEDVHTSISKRALTDIVNGASVCQIWAYYFLRFRTHIKSLQTPKEQIKRIVMKFIEIFMKNNHTHMP